MRLMKAAAVTVIILFICSAAGATHPGPEDRGKALFNDVKFAEGTSGKSCGSCHPDGKGLGKAGEKKEFNIMGKKQKSLEEAINACIINANKGKALDVKSEQMKDLSAYIRSLKVTVEKKAVPGY